MNRREALRTIGTGTALTALGTVIAATTSCAPTEAPAAEVDPTFAAIEQHKAAWAAWTSLDLDRADDPIWEQHNKAEVDAWETVCQVQPETMAGLVAMSGYIGRFSLSELPPDGIAIHKAFVTISTAAARLAFLEGRDSA